MVGYTVGKGVYCTLEGQIYGQLHGGDTDIRPGNVTVQPGVFRRCRFQTLYCGVVPKRGHLHETITFYNINDQNT